VKFLIFALALQVLTFFSCETTEPQADVPAKRTASSASTNSEYSRSVAALGHAISEETFYADKSAIMAIIADLQQIMAKKDVARWRVYLSPASVAYLKNPTNLKAISTKLPAQFAVRNDMDFFNYVFIPARQGRKIDEIRYISPTEVKAVQVQANNAVIY
jgi:hypothetical protein